MLNLLGHRLARIVNLKRRLMDRLPASNTLVRSQRQVMLTLYNVGDCTQKDLLDQLDMDAAQLARVLESLESDGFIRRAPLPSNRRCTFVQMNDAVKASAMPALISVVNDLNDVLLRGFTESEQEQAQQFVARMESNLVNYAKELRDE